MSLFIKNMFQATSCLKVFDNSGAKKVFFIKPVGKRNSRVAKINELIKVSVRSLRTKGNIRVEVGVMYIALIVKTRFNLCRFSGNHLKFANNGVILLDAKKNNMPKGTRIFGIVTKELRYLKFLKVLSLSSYIV